MTSGQPTHSENEKSDSAAPARSELRGLIAAHRALIAFFSVCVVAGAIAGAVFLADDWSLVRRLAGGAVAGAGFAMLVTGPKLMVR